MSETLKQRLRRCEEKLGLHANEENLQVLVKRLQQKCTEKSNEIFRLRGQSKQVLAELREKLKEVRTLIEQSDAWVIEQSDLEELGLL